MARHLSLNCGASGASPVTLLNLDPQLTFWQAATSATKHPLNRSFFKLTNLFASLARIFHQTLVKTTRKLLLAPAPRNLSRRMNVYFNSRLTPFPILLVVRDSCGYS
jgi:hypothetical protein